jgi:hypothetical protein
MQRPLRCPTVLRHLYNESGDWGPLWDHTLCAMVSDLRVCERLARARSNRVSYLTCGNASPLFTWGASGARLEKG